ncbi:MAG TPA: response regulator [Methylocella sp.]|jgi:DNA-binding response OmpR family regulator|nr:response regulator [Methylocella sp.]
MDSNPKSPASRPRILLVEDEPVIALALESTLRELGFDVVATAARISSALEAARRQTIDYAILDVNLGAQRVDAVADVLAARGCPFFFMTGYGTSDLPPRHADRAVLQKPFRLEQLFAVLRAEFGLLGDGSGESEEDSPAYRNRRVKPRPPSGVPTSGP